MNSGKAGPMKTDTRPNKNPNVLIARATPNKKINIPYEANPCALASGVIRPMNETTSVINFPNDVHIVGSCVNKSYKT